MHAFRKTPFAPFAPLSPLPVNATTPPATIDAVCLSELIILIITATESRPVPPGWTHSLTHSPIPSHSLTSHTLAWMGDAISTSVTAHGAPHRIGNAREVRNLFAGRMATAVVGHPTQPDSQPKSISVALPTATQTRFMPFPVLLRSPSSQCRMLSHNVVW
jgi:hypothetical protein